VRRTLDNWSFKLELAENMLDRFVNAHVVDDDDGIKVAMAIDEFAEIEKLYTDLCYPAEVRKVRSFVALMMRSCTRSLGRGLPGGARHHGREDEPVPRSLGGRVGDRL
jgi:hypothetical protein